MRHAGAQLTLDEYRKQSRARVEATNHPLRNIPHDRVRYQLCWGSWNGPHIDDIESLVAGCKLATKRLWGQAVSA